jgi:hypothetical protein
LRLARCINSVWVKIQTAQVLGAKKMTDKEGTVATMLEGGYGLFRDAHRAAEKIGCDCVSPNESQLQLDLDNDQQYKLFQKRYREYKIIAQHLANYTVTGYKIKPSKSGLPHRHITITVVGHEFDRWERVCLQFMLGSDFVRESLNTLRLISGHPNPSVLFEKKKEESK